MISPLTTGLGLMGGMSLDSGLAMLHASRSELFLDNVALLEEGSMEGLGLMISNNNLFAPNDHIVPEGEERSGSPQAVIIPE
jgi:hypothetical protein